MSDQWLKENAVRLLREKWRNPEQLAQEIYMIASDEPASPVSAVEPAVRARLEEARRQLLPDVSEAGAASVQTQIQRGPGSQQPPTPTNPQSPPPFRSADTARSQPPVVRRQALAELAGLTNPAPRRPSPTEIPGTEPSAQLPGEIALAAIKKRQLGALYNPKPIKYEMPLLDWNSMMGLGTGGGGSSTRYGQIVDENPQASPSGSDSPAYSVQLFRSGSVVVPAVGTGVVVVTMLGLDSTEKIPVGTWVFGIASFSDPVQPSANVLYEATIPMWLA